MIDITNICKDKENTATCTSISRKQKPGANQAAGEGGGEGGPCLRCAGGVSKTWSDGRGGWRM